MQFYSSQLHHCPHASPWTCQQNSCFSIWPFSVPCAWRPDTSLNYSLTFSRSLFKRYHLRDALPIFFVCLFFIVSPVQFSHSVVSDSLWPHGLQHDRLPCPTPTPKACSKSCPLSQWCHQTISSSIVPFSSFLQSLPASRSFPKSQFFAPGGQHIGVSA